MIYSIVKYLILMFFKLILPQFINQARLVKYDKQIYFDKTFTDLWFINHAIVEIVVSRSLVH